MFKKSIIDTYGYETSSITEDLEYTIQCLLNGKKIMFVEDAITYDEQPTDFKVSFVQRLRWSRGNLQCWAKYHKDLIK